MWAAGVGYRVSQLKGPPPPPLPVFVVARCVVLMCERPNDGQVTILFHLPLDWVKEQMADVDRKSGPGHLADIENLMARYQRSRNWVEPVGATDLFEVSSISMIQKLRIDPANPATYNRFMDGLNEVANAAATVLAFIKGLPYVTPRSLGVADLPPARPPSEPPQGIYS
jgi:hypothetical protein